MVKFYLCETCKNIITKIVDSKVPVVCCGSYPDISYGIKLGNHNIGNTNNIYTFPYFCTFKIKEYLRTKENH